MVRIVTDSASDVPADVAAALQIGVVPIILEIDGVVHHEGVRLSRQQFYDDLPRYRDIPKTAAPSTEDFLDVYRAAHASGGDEVIAIILSKELSSLYSVAELAAQHAAAEGLRVHVVNSGWVAIGLGFLAIEAARLAQQGASARDILAMIEVLRKRMYVYALCDTLKYLRRGGRVNAITAGVGEFLQIKLVLEVRDSIVSQLDRVRTRSRGIERLIEVTRSHPRIRQLAVLHSGGDNAKDLELLKSRVRDLTPGVEQWVLEVTPVIGTHVGPMALGIGLIADV
jgi:DegV family protein with EDD domain